MDTNFARSKNMILALRLIHMFAAAFLVGTAAFHFFLLRPALRLIPPAHGATVARRLGSLMIYLNWTALGLLLLSGILRLYLRGDLEPFLSLDLFAESHLRALALMSFAWLILLGLSSYMTILLRSHLAQSSAPAAATRGGNGGTQAEALLRLDLAQRLVVVISTLALLAGASMVDGGLF